MYLHVATHNPKTTTIT